MSRIAIQSLSTIPSIKCMTQASSHSNFKSKVSYWAVVPSSVLTVGEHAWGGELYVGQSSQMVEHSTAVALLLGVIHKGPDVVLLTMVTDTWAYHHGDVICWNSKQDRWLFSHKKIRYVNADKRK